MLEAIAAEMEPTRVKQDPLIPYALAAVAFPEAYEGWKRFNLGGNDVVRADTLITASAEMALQIFFLAHWKYLLH